MPHLQDNDRRLKGGSLVTILLTAAVLSSISQFFRTTSARGVLTEADVGALFTSQAAGESFSSNNSEKHETLSSQLSAPLSPCSNSSEIRNAATSDFAIV